MREVLPPKIQNDGKTRRNMVCRPQSDTWFRTRRLPPVLIVQNDAINRFSMTILAVPITSNLRRGALPSCVAVSSGEGGLTVGSVLLCHQLRALDQSRLLSKLGEVSAETMTAVESCILFRLCINLGE